MNSTCGETMASEHASGGNTTAERSSAAAEQECAGCCCRSFVESWPTTGHVAVRNAHVSFQGRHPVRGGCRSRGSRVRGRRLKQACGGCCSATLASHVADVCPKDNGGCCTTISCCRWRLWGSGGSGGSSSGGSSGTTVGLTHVLCPGGVYNCKFSSS